MTPKRHGAEATRPEQGRGNQRGHVARARGKGEGNYRNGAHGKICGTTTRARKRSIMIGGKMHHVTAQTEGDINAALDKIVSEAHEAGKAEAPTLGAWLALWVDEIAETKTESTRVNRLWAIGKLAPLHGRRMNEIMAPDVERVLQRYAAKGMRRNSIARMRTVGGQAFASYNGRHGKTFNPFRAATNIGDPAPKVEKHALTPKQTRALLAVADATPRYGILAHLGVWLGLRPGEVAGLTWMRSTSPRASYTFAKCAASTWTTH